MKLWQGRMSGDINSKLQEMNASIRFDSRMATQDIRGSIVHATMLGDAGIISTEDSGAIIEGLTGILADLQNGRLLIDETAEDIHMFVEQVLTERLGDVGKKLHTGRSRNDQVALDIRLYLNDETDEIIGLLADSVAALCEVAKQHVETVMPGYTHLQRAQPVTLGHYLMAYAQMLLRDIERLLDCKKRICLSPLGSGALAGTTYPLNRQQVADLLGFSGITANSIDGVSDRDFIIELCGGFAMVMMHLSRMCEEFILWCSWEYRFMAFSDAFSTGSSIMPQKKNPDLCELIRGKTARVYGDLTTLLTIMKGLPLAYNKDMQEDKEAIFDAVDTVKACASVLPDMLISAAFNKENMAAAAKEGFINATDCADYLTKKGVPFRDAYRMTGELVKVCIDEGCTLDTLPLSRYQQVCRSFEEDIYKAIDLVHCATARDVAGGPAPQRVLEQIHKALATVKAVKEA